MKDEFEEFGRFFGELLKEKRNKAGLNQSALSFRSNVSVDSIRSIECGRIKSPGLLIASMLVKALGGNLDEWLSLLEKRRQSERKNKFLAPKKSKK